MLYLSTMQLSLGFQLTSSGRRGRIPVQPTALTRRQTLPKGRQIAPQGRPRKAFKNAHGLTKKPFKARKPHNLSLNIAKCTHNAKCHWKLTLLCKCNCLVPLPNEKWGRRWAGDDHCNFKYEFANSWTKHVRTGPKKKIATRPAAYLVPRARLLQQRARRTPWSQ